MGILCGRNGNPMWPKWESYVAEMGILCGRKWESDVAEMGTFVIFFVTSRNPVFQ